MNASFKIDLCNRTLALSLITMKPLKYFICVALLAVSGSVLANSFTFVTPPGATTSGGPVDAQAVFTTSANTLMITLTDLQPNPTDVAQLLSDLFFSLNNASGVASMLTSSSAMERTVNGNGTFTDGSTVSTGWAFSNPSPNNFLLNVLGTPIGPAHLIIGPPGPGGIYSNANGSIAGNGPHNPFLNGSATFNLSIPGINANTVVTGATFSFGTTAGINVVGIPQGVPDGGSSAMLLGFAFIGLTVMHRLAKKS